MQLRRRRLELRHAMNYRPTVAAALAAAAGLLWGFAAQPAWLVAAAAAGALLAALFAWKRRGALLVLVIGFLCGAARAYVARMPDVPTERGMLVGTIAETPEARDYGYYLVLRDATLDDVPVQGRVILYLLGEGAGPIAYGSHIMAQTQLSPMPGRRNQGGMDLARYYAGKGVVAMGFASYYAGVAGEEDFYGALLRVREGIGERINLLFGNGAGVVAGILLGDKSGLYEEEVRAFQDTGTAHLLAVSGLHVSILVVGLGFFFKRANPVARLIVTGVFLTGYVLVTGFAASILRAAIMIMTQQTARALGRNDDGPTALAFSALLILAFAPYEIYSAGFQLSYCAVAGIYMLYEPIGTLLKKMFKPLADSLAVTAAATLGTVPVSVWHFYRLPLLGLFANALAVPVSALIVLPAAGAVALSYAYLPLAAPFAWATDVCVRLMMGAIEGVAKIPGGVLVVAWPSLLACGLFGLLLLSLSKYVLLPKGTKRVTAGILALAFAASLAMPVLARKEEVRASALADSAAVYVRMGEAHHVLALGDDSRTLQAFLSANGVAELEAVWIWREEELPAAGELLSSFPAARVMVAYGRPELVRALQALGIDAVAVGQGEMVPLTRDFQALARDGGLLLTGGWYSLFLSGGSSGARLVAWAGAAGKSVTVAAPGKAQPGQYDPERDGQVDILLDEGTIWVQTPYK